MKKGKNSVPAMLTLILQMGITMLVPITVCTLAGVSLGKKLNADWISVVFFIIGAAAGMNSCYKLIRGFLKDMPREEL